MADEINTIDVFRDSIDVYELSNEAVQVIEQGPQGPPGTGGGGGGSGTVTSVALAGTGLSISGSPVTTSGTITASVAYGTSTSPNTLMAQLTITQPFSLAFGGAGASYLPTTSTQFYATTTGPYKCWKNDITQITNFWAAGGGTVNSGERNRGALEVMAVRTDRGLLVIHAMALRPKWRHLYEEGKR
jgi:hypothetical protein